MKALKVRLTYHSHPMTEPFYRYKLRIISWQDLQYANGTFSGTKDSDEWDFDVKEIQDLLKEAKIDSAGEVGVT